MLGRLTCPLGPIPLAACGLAAVLARALPAGGGGLPRRDGGVLGQLFCGDLNWFIEAPVEANGGARVVLVDGDVDFVGEFVHEE